MKVSRAIQIFHFVINGFYVFGNKFFSKKNKYYIILQFFYLIIAYAINERPHDTLSVFDQGAIEHFWGGKYGFTASEAFSSKF